MFKFILADLHHDNIRSDFPDTFKWNNIFRIIPEQTADPAWSRYNDCLNTSIAHIQFHIHDTPQPVTIA